MNIVELVRQAGVVGAGGAGFPTHVKLRSRAEWFLGNGAECEPLLHKDRELMIHYPEQVLEGLRLSASSVGATKLRIGVKSKNAHAIAALQSAGGDRAVEISEFGDFYPSGDEYEVVYSITGRLMPPGGIPLDVGVVVNNVETLYQVSRAAEGKPVTESLMTIGGLVRNPITVWAPLGMHFSDVIALAGGATINDFAVMESGLMMGRLVRDLNKPVTKTTSGLIVLPRNHAVVQRYSTPPEAQARIGKSACDQCSYCTELCPRYLLGYDIQPHAVMRSLGFSATGSAIWNQYALLCCGCGICTLYACPESLYPREACLQGIADLRSTGVTRQSQPGTQVQAHPMKEFRRVPMSLLMKRLDVLDLDAEAPLVAVDMEPAMVTLPLKQHIGAPASPCVQVGDPVRKGQLVAGIPEDQLGAAVHASIDGRVSEVGSHIRIERK